MKRKRGKTIPLGNERRLVCDIMRLAKRVPLAPLASEIDVSELKKMRRLANPRPGWQIIMMRAYALLAKEMPQLRQVYSPLPWPTIYQHDETVCLLTIARQEAGRERLFFARFCQPENFTLGQLQQQFDDYRKLPVSELRQLKHQVRFAALPGPIRRVGWGLLTHWMPASRARQMGTFGMSLSGFRGVHGTYHLSPCTTTLGYDQLCRDGKARLTLTFDHRILDGKPASYVLERLQVILKTRITDELRMMIPRKTDKDNGRVSTQLNSPTANDGLAAA